MQIGSKGSHYFPKISCVSSSIGEHVNTQFGVLNADSAQASPQKMVSLKRGHYADFSHWIAFV